MAIIGAHEAKMKLIDLAVKLRSFLDLCTTFNGALLEPSRVYCRRYLLLYLENKEKKLIPLDNCLYNPQTKLILYYFYLRYYYQHLLRGSFLFRFYTASLCIRLFCQMQDRLIFQ